MSLTPGAKFRLAIEQNNPLQIVGTINPYCAMMAKNLGHQAIIHCEGEIARLSALVDREQHADLKIGDCVSIKPKPGAVHCFHAETGERLSPTMTTGGEQ